MTRKPRSRVDAAATEPSGPDAGASGVCVDLVIIGADPDLVMPWAGGNTSVKVEACRTCFGVMQPVASTSKGGGWDLDTSKLGACPGCGPHAHYLEMRQGSKCPVLLRTWSTCSALQRSLWDSSASRTPSVDNPAARPSWPHTAFGRPTPMLTAFLRAQPTCAEPEGGDPRDTYGERLGRSCP